MVNSTKNKGGAPIGNKNNTKAKPWIDAINRALARRAKDHTVEGGLNALADKFLDACENGDSWAMKEIGDRCDGRAAQQIIHTGDEDAPIAVKEVALVRPSPTEE